MKQLNTIRETRTWLGAHRKKGQSIGFVPTMGALHEGHLALIRRSLAENDLTVCSIFVNPIQFNNKEDLSRYLRTLPADARLLEQEGCHLLFAPDSDEMYPKGETEPFSLDFGMLDKVMEGKFRPGHFKGVAIVVKKLFEIVGPGKAYFGKKDFQQLAVISHMVREMKIPVTIVPCETIREADGLAMSSRNMRLTIAERNIAPRIYEVLTRTRDRAGKIPVRELKEWAIKKIQENPAMRVEYFEIGDRESLMPFENWAFKERALAFTAVFLGDVRLIDNIELFS
jgi:pantoate--beta-alanine ligase